MVIWDLPIRLFHWSFMACVFGAIISGKMNEWSVHERFGLAIMGLVVFRIIWGFVGSDTARFSNFLTGPKKVFSAFRDLLQKTPTDKAGHSPVGGYATLALLLIPLMMAVTGSFSSDDILYDGPFYHLLPQFADRAGDIHHFGEKLIFLIIILHLAALSYYRLRLRKNLVKPMITGKGAKAAGAGGTLSKARTVFGISLMISLVIVAQLATQLRPSYF